MSRASVPDAQPVTGGARPASNRKFWYVVAPLLVAGVVIGVGTILTRPDTSYREGGPEPRQNLRQARRAADIVRKVRGSYADATPDELGVVELTLAFVPGDQASTGPREISVLADAGRWVGAAFGGKRGCYVLAVEDGRPPVEDVIDPGGPQAGCTADAMAARLGVRLGTGAP